MAAMALVTHNANLNKMAKIAKKTKMPKDSRMSKTSKMAKKGQTDHKFKIGQMATTAKKPNLGRWQDRPS